MKLGSKDLEITDVIEENPEPSDDAHKKGKTEITVDQFTGVKTTQTTDIRTIETSTVIQETFKNVVEKNPHLNMAVPKSSRVTEDE
jgi:hypothetical protein